MTRMPKKRSSIFLSKLRSFFQESQKATIPTDHPRPVKLQIPTSAYPPISPPLSPRNGQSIAMGLSHSRIEEAVAADNSKLERVQEGTLSLTPSNSSNDNSAGRSGSRPVSQDSRLEPSTDRRLGGSDILPMHAHHSSPPPPSPRLALGHTSQGHLDVFPDLGRSVLRGNRHPTPSLPLDELEFNRLDVSLADYLIELCSDLASLQCDALHRFFDLRRPIAYTTADYQLSQHPSMDLKPSETVPVPPISNEKASLSASIQNESDDMRQSAHSPPSSSPVRIIAPAEAVPKESSILAHTRSLENHSAGTSAQRWDNDPYISPSDDAVPNESPYGEMEIDNSPPASELEPSRIRPSKSHKITVDDFDLIRTLGKGCAGKVSRPHIRITEVLTVANSTGGARPSQEKQKGVRSEGDGQTASSRSI